VSDRWLEPNKPAKRTTPKFRRQSTKGERRQRCHQYYGGDHHDRHVESTICDPFGRLAIAEVARIVLTERGDDGEERVLQRWPGDEA
jgi:hypothetical protein